MSLTDTLLSLCDEFHNSFAQKMIRQRKEHVQKLE